MLSMKIKRTEKSAAYPGFTLLQRLTGKLLDEGSLRIIHGASHLKHCLKISPTQIPHSPPQIFDWKAFSSWWHTLCCFEQCESKYKTWWPLRRPLFQPSPSQYCFSSIPFYHGTLFACQGVSACTQRKPPWTRLSDILISKTSNLRAWHSCGTSLSWRHCRGVL